MKGWVPYQRKISSVSHGTTSCKLYRATIQNLPLGLARPYLSGLVLAQKRAPCFGFRKTAALLALSALRKEAEAGFFT